MAGGEEEIEEDRGSCYVPQEQRLTFTEVPRLLAPVMESRDLFGPAALPEQEELQPDRSLGLREEWS